MSAKVAGAVLLVAGLVLCFVDKPVHVDDANFLRLAEGAARDPWRPHDVLVNWEGTTERAFDVLSNPPGIAWWLLPVRNAPEWAMHAWMLPWLAFALWAAARLARAFEVPVHRAILLLGTSPMFVLSAQSLTPDLPLLACVLAGVAGFAAGGRWAGAWAFVAGASALFRYSGLCFIPLVLLVGWERGRLRAALPVFAAPALLALHDVHAYGGTQLFASVAFQGSALEPGLMLQKLAASLAMLGGACLLPVLPWRRGALPLAAAGALLGLGAGVFVAQTPRQLAATVPFCAAGGLALGSLAARTREDRFLGVWFLGGWALIAALSFVAVRRWLPFAPALMLAALRRAPPRPHFAAAIALAAALSFALARDDDGFARAYRDAAREIAESGPPGLVSGHWGWQHYLERAGWSELERGAPVSGRLAVAFEPWPQRSDTRQCLAIESSRTLESGWPIRAYSRKGAANFHSSWIAGDPRVASYAPWTFSSEPYDRAVVFAPCEDAGR